MQQSGSAWPQIRLVTEMDKASTVASDMSDIARWTSYDSARHSINGSGQLAIAPPASTSAYYPLKHLTHVDLTNSWVYVEVIGVLAAGSGPETIFQLELDASNLVSFIKSNTSLICRKKVANSNSDTGPTYNSSTHRWWRIGESGGNILWDTSPDGVTWTNRRSFATPFAITDLIIGLSAGVFNTSFPTPGTAIFDNLNLPHPRSFFMAS